MGVTVGTRDDLSTINNCYTLTPPPHKKAWDAFEHTYPMTSNLASLRSLGSRFRFAISINQQSTLYFHQKQYIKTIIKNTHTQKPYVGVDWKANKAC